MNAIFLSYSREDREPAARVARALRSEGWLVWWDEEIALGDRFDEKTEQELERAGCVVVLWSRASVRSDWVKAEASAARQRGVLVPVLIEPVTPPLEFRRVQTGSLIGWAGDVRERGFQQLLSAVGRVHGGDGPPPAPGAVSTAATGRRPWSRAAAPAVALLPTVIIAIAVVVLAAWHVPTRVRVTVPVQRATFTVGAADAALVRVLDALAFPDLTIARFESVVFEPEAIATADTTQYVLAEDRYPESAWRQVPVPASGELRFAALSARMLPSLTIQWPAPGHGAPGGLRPIAVPPAAEVTMELSNPRSLSLVLRSPRRTVLAVPATGLLLITATQTTVDGIDGDMNPRPAGAWRVRLRDGAAPVAVQGRDETLALSVTLPAADGERLPLFSGGAIAIDAIDFSTQDEFGRRVSSVAAGGRLELPDLPSNQPFVLERSSVVTLQGLDRFAMRGISVDSRRRLQVEVEGIAGTVWTESGAIRTDHRATAFAMLRRHRAWTVGGILLWMLATGIAIRGCRSVAARV